MGTSRLAIDMRSITTRMCVVVVLIACSISLGTPQYFSATGHYYELIQISGGLSWDAARADAESRIYNGFAGHLVTVNSPQENDFILTNLLNVASDSRYWIGGYQPAGSVEPDGNWRWVTGEPWGFAGWRSGEPSNDGSYSDEDAIDIYASDGAWNDLHHSRLLSYVIEYQPIPQCFSGTGHYYEVVQIPGGLTWNQAEIAANSLYYSELTGHLVTISSQAENDFVKNALLSSASDSSYWIGGYQPAGSREPDGNWKWITGEPWLFTNWKGGEPNNGGSYNDENCIEIYTYSASLGVWNDVHFSAPRSMIVEYESDVIAVINVTAKTRSDDSGFTDIHYGLIHANNNMCAISVEISNDGGSTYNVPATSFTGDIGPGVTPGTGKHIIWDCKADLPGVVGRDYRIRIIADDGD